MAPGWRLLPADQGQRPFQRPFISSGHLAESAGTSSQPLFRVTRSLENVAEGSWPTTGAIVLACCRQGPPSPSGEGRGRDLGREFLPRPRAQAGRREGSADGVVRSQALWGPVSRSTSSDRPHQPSSPLREVRPGTARRWVAGARPCRAGSSLHRDVLTTLCTLSPPTSPLRRGTPPYLSAPARLPSVPTPHLLLTPATKTANNNNGASLGAVSLNEFRGCTCP